MLSPRRQDSILHLSHSAIPLLLVLALQLGACGDSDSPLAPGGADEALVTADEAPQASPPEALVTALTSPRIAFSSYRNSNNDIYLMDPQGYQVKRITTASTWEGSPSWSWDNKRIALVRPRKDASNVTHYDIYLINADGTNGHWARSTPSPYNLAHPSWHPDGSHILVTITAQDGRWYVGWLNLASGTIGSFTIGGQPVLGKQPSYDATGQRIVYVSTSSYKYSLDLVNANGSGHVTLLSASGSTIDGPAFSRDGKRIAFSNVAGNGDQEIFIKSLVDGSVKRLTYTTGTDLWPSWSPDGSKIVFGSSRNGQLQIWSMSATGGSATRISHNKYAERTPAYSH
jgi:Tol biopolymer transport system component